MKHLGTAELLLHLVEIELDALVEQSMINLGLIDNPCDYPIGDIFELMCLGYNMPFDLWEKECIQKQLKEMEILIPKIRYYIKDGQERLLT